jgi:hypothetical protein
VSTTRDRLLRTLARLPARLANSVPWAHVEPAGLGAGPTGSGDPDERADQRRRARELWRSEDPGRTDRGTGAT